MKKIAGLICILLVCASCEDIIEVQDISDKVVTLVAPADTVALNSANILFFDWETLEDAETYRIQIATPTFAEAVQIIADSTLSETSFSTTLEISTYEWRVKAENSGYQTMYTTQSFTVE